MRISTKKTLEIPNHRLEVVNKTAIRRSLKIYNRSSMKLRRGATK